MSCACNAAKGRCVWGRAEPVCLELCTFDPYSVQCTEDNRQEGSAPLSHVCVQAVCISDIFHMCYCSTSWEPV